MPGSKELLASQVWQEIPDVPGLTIWPLIRKIDTVSSNSYLISTPDALVLIDPGGLQNQVEQLSSLISSCRWESDRPVFVMLTHAHIDHFAGVQQTPSFAHHSAVVFAVQEAGAHALEAGDVKVTQGDLLQVPVYPMKIGFPLLTMERSLNCGVPVELCFSNGATINVIQDRFSAGDGYVTIPREQIRFGNGTVLEVYHTPGHSPDSICLRIGGLLFIGDLLFAANPGVAGMRGWSQDDLIRTLDFLEHFIPAAGIKIVCPGHGRALDAQDAARMLARVRTDALALSGIAELNRERAVQTAAFADDCMEQINELFTIMSGRLYYASHVMDELGESGLAEKTDSLINGETIDELLEAFQAFSEEHHQGRTIPIHLVLKAGQVIAKLERSFSRDELAGIIDPTLVARAGRLLSDYTTMLRGFNPPAEISEYDLVSIAGAVVTGLSVPACSDEEVLENLGDDEAFSRILLTRIGARPLLEDVQVTVKTGNVPLCAWVDREHFIDLLTYLLGDLVGTGADTVDLGMTREDDRIALTLAGNVSSSGPPTERRTWRFMSGLAVRAGGDLSCQCDTKGTEYRFTAPAAGGPASSGP